MSYVFKDGNWSQIDDKITDFKSVKKQLGFTNETEVFYPLGKGVMHSGKNAPKTQYGFVFVFNMGLGGDEYRVWIPSLPDLFQFLKVIGATTHDNLVDYLKTTYFSDAMSVITSVLSDISIGEALKVEVKK